MEFSKDQRESIFDEMFIFVFIGVLAILAMILLSIVYKLFSGTSLADRVKEELT